MTRTQQQPHPQGVPFGPRLIPGRVYVYIRDLPAGCRGGLYRLVRFVRDEPSKQQKVLVQCLSGKDAGLWFVCSESNFATRYVPLVTTATTLDPPAVPASSPPARTVAQVDPKYATTIANITTRGRE